MDHNCDYSSKYNYLNYFIRGVVFSFLYVVRISIEIPELKMEGLISSTIMAITSFLAFSLEFVYLILASIISTSSAELISPSLKNADSEYSQEEISKINLLGNNEDYILSFIIEYEINFSENSTI
jgi:hypothetical protein